MTKSIKKKITRRQAIEPHCGHMKAAGKLGKCRLWDKKEIKPMPYW